MKIGTVSPVEKKRGS
jgi:hypothetical protein